jgi:insulinase (Peptidase family M16)
MRRLYRVPPCERGTTFSAVPRPDTTSARGASSRPGEPGGPLRPLAVVLLATLLVAACSGGGGSHDDGAGSSRPDERAEANAGDGPIPFDGRVRRTVLANGLTVYVRDNDAPGGQAQLRLVVDAGSVLEDDDQLGAAHFLEHMLFMGTQAYPERRVLR